MPTQAPQLKLTLDYEPTGLGLFVRYTPIGSDGSKIAEWAGTLHLFMGAVPPHLGEKLGVFFNLASQQLPERSVEFPDGTRAQAGRPGATRFSVSPDAPPIPDLVQVFTGSPQHLNLAIRVAVHEFSLDGQRLYRDILVSIESECWKHLASRLGTSTSEPNLMQVFISYRKRPDIEQFAEAVAVRLEHEGIRPRFDKWDMLAGDSLAGKINEGFAASRACLIVLSAEFTSGKWATAEMHTAITKRVNEGYRVIPAVFEDCEIPELLKDPIRVDFRDHDPDRFESRMREIVQSLFGLRRPF